MSDRGMREEIEREREQAAERVEINAHEIQKAEQRVQGFGAVIAGKKRAPVLVREVVLPIRATHKPGRNDPCACGSGLKFKRCCGRLQQ